MMPPCLPLRLTRPPQPYITPEDLTRLTSRITTFDHRHAVLSALRKIDSLQQNHDALRQVRWGVFSLAAGFAFAVFPFTPGIVDYCKPSANPGWLCGARAAALLSACEAVVVGVSTGFALYKDQRRMDQEAARISLDIGARHGHWTLLPGNLIETYRKLGPTGKQRIRDFLDAPGSVEMV